MNTIIRDLEVAIAQGDTAEVVQLVSAEPSLLEVRFTSNVGLSPLMWACRNRHVTIVEFLLQKGATVHEINPLNPDGEGGNSALWFTAQGAWPGGVAIARLLLDHGAIVDQRCQLGTTAFFIATSWAAMEMAQFLLSQGADPSIVNTQGNSALDEIRKGYAWAQSQDTRTEEVKLFALRAPRMIEFLEKLQK